MEREGEKRKKNRTSGGGNFSTPLFLSFFNVLTLSPTTQIFVLENELTNIEIMV